MTQDNTSEKGENKKNPLNKMKNSVKGKNKSAFNPFMAVIIFLLVWAVLSFIATPLLPEYSTKEIPITDLFKDIESGNVKNIAIKGDSLYSENKDGEKTLSKKEPQSSFIELLIQKNIPLDNVEEGIKAEKGVDWLMILSNLAFPIIMIGFLWWLFRSAGKSSSGVFGLGKSKAKLFTVDQNKIGFDDVAGAGEVKEELFEIVDFLKKPEKYRKLGARIPKGILLIGPSGVGKTLLARAIAGEANVPFYSVAGSEFIEMIVGVGSARVRDLFKMAKETSPSLIFIDEIDAIGRHRGKSMVSSNDEREQTLNQILVEMDGFDPRTNVIIIAATNRPDMLDSALVRPGRFDRHIRIDLPDVQERKDIIKIHMRGKPFNKEVSVEMIAKRTAGFSGADIENMLNEAAILAARRNAKEIILKDLTDASTKVKLGPERKLLQTEEEKKVVAYHEAGHALVGYGDDDSDSVGRISIISRSMSLGHTEFLPQENIYNQTKNKLLASIRMSLGGRAAEELIFNQETIGAAGDIERATYIARKMVTDFGMSSLGPINYVSGGEGMWDYASSNKAVGYSEDIAKKIDEEVRAIIDSEYKKAMNKLKENRKMLDKIAGELLKKETLEQDEFEKLMKE